MKHFLGLPIRYTSNPITFVGQFIGITLSTGLSYFILTILLGLIVSGEHSTYIQSIEKNYILQFILLLSAVFMGIGLRIIANLRWKFFYIIPNFDKYIYPIGFIVSYMAINEIWGF